jgi:hypothetical protein
LSIWQKNSYGIWEYRDAYNNTNQDGSYKRAVFRR